MKRSGTSSKPSKLDRKTVERNRRIHMKGLCFRLASLIPSHRYETSKNVLSQLDRLDLAASYIKELKDRIDTLTRRKELATRSRRPNCNNIEGCRSKSGAELPIIQLREWHSGIDLSLVTGAYKNFTLCEVISILQEEGAEVVSASFSTIGDKIFHTLHAQAKILRVGIETTRVRERLQELTRPSCACNQRIRSSRWE